MKIRPCSYFISKRLIKRSFKQGFCCYPKSLACMILWHYICTISDIFCPYFPQFFQILSSLSFSTSHYILLFFRSALISMISIVYTSTRNTYLVYRIFLLALESSFITFADTMKCPCVIVISNFCFFYVQMRRHEEW